jgi:predicted NodU family carbamoyl transferase
MDLQRIYISHWFDHFDLMENSFQDKHWHQDYVKELCATTGAEVVSLTPAFTHHDAHAWAAWAFFETHAKRHSRCQPAVVSGRLLNVPTSLGPIHVCVADGFGNREEVVSLYQVDVASGTLVLQNRLYGYENSLGLLYQYATSFVGMKENQDEYKFLGYESRVLTYFSRAEVNAVQSEARLYIDSQEARHESTNQVYVDVPRLQKIKIRVHQTLDRVIQRATGRDRAQLSQMELRSLVAVFIQTALEYFYTTLIERFHIKNLVVTGGVHYNVKLNNRIFKAIPGIFCAVPLAGDQGAAIGLERYYEGDIKGLETLCWGKRDLNMKRPDGVKIGQNAIYFTDRGNYVNFVTERIASGQIVNTVTGTHEFGPRALCHTSTLAVPRVSHVQAINAMNGRDTVMPMAPVMLAANAHQFFKLEDLSRVVGSLEFMILTLDYHSTVDPELFRGVMHPYPLSPDTYSGRPQIVTMDEGPIQEILADLQHEWPAIINTSFNVHGQPIVNTVDHALADQAYNIKRADELGLPHPVLAVGNF